MRNDLRAWWWHRQGLDGSLAGASPAEVLDRAGWARSVGGSNPYLTLFARAGTSRVDADAAVAELAIHELPSARGCTYVVPAADFGLALQVGRHAPEADVAKAEKLGVPRGEIERLGAAVVAALAGGPLDPAALKVALGDAVRNLGAEGKKKGITTTLRWFTAFTARRAKEIVAGLDLVDLGDGVLALADDAKAYAQFNPPARPRYALLAGTDALVLLRRDVPSLLDPADALRPIPGESGARLGEQPDLPDHPIVDRGRIVGHWQYDVETQR